VRRYWQRLEASHPALKFALVGSVGFAVDSALLILLFEFLQLGLEVSRVAAFVCAATVNWFLNRVFTFAERDRRGRKSLQWMRFVASAIVSAIPNLGIFFLLMLILPESLGFVLIAMCCGILAGYYCNYRLAHGWVFGIEAR
jgi:putative flippase GtrA